MTSRFSLLVASTALTVAFGLPVLAAMDAPGATQGQCSGVCAAVFGADDGDLPLIRVNDDDDDDDDGGWVRRGHDDDDDGDCDDEDDDEDDDDDDDDHDDDDDDDDDDNCTGTRGNPAPAGTVPPPANGLFGTGAPPVAVTN
jgi:hypothetical protein